MRLYSISRTTTTVAILVYSIFSTGIQAQDAAAAGPSTTIAPVPEPTPVAVSLNPTDPQCIEYQRIANLSTIGGNSTYRAAFLQASRQGTMVNSLMLNAAVAKGTPMITDVDINSLCGNWTAIALAGAEFNFTQGVVAQFSGITGNPQAIVSGVIIPVVVLLILLVQFLVFFFAP